MKVKPDDVLCVLLLVCLVVVACVQVVFRFLLDFPLGWSEEFLRYTFIALVYLAASMGVRDQGMIKIGLLDLLLPAKVKVVLDVSIDAVTAAFCLFMAYLILTPVKHAFAAGLTSSALGWPMGGLYVGMLVLFLLIAVRYLLLVVRACRGTTS